jgi:hypothetical protein
MPRWEVKKTITYTLEVEAKTRKEAIDWFLKDDAVIVKTKFTARVVKED